MPTDDKASIWRPFTQMQTAAKPPSVESASGALLKLTNGKTVIDAISSWWVITHGHCQPEIMSAIQNQSKKLDQVLFANFTHEIAEELVMELSSLLPKPLSKVFFSDNGSTAVEVAIKMAIQYWKNIGVSNKKKVMCFKHSYHGDTIGAMSVSGRSAFTDPFKDLLFDVISLNQGKFSTDCESYFLDDFLIKMKQFDGQIAAIILEPLVQGAGGMIVWPNKVVKKICEIAKENNILVIFDEVMTGFGRTGSCFALDQLSITPDLLCLSKGLTGGALPLSLTVSSTEIYNSFLSNEKKDMFFHGHSFTGNPITCSAALASVKLFKSRDYKLKWEKIEYINKLHIEDISNKFKIKDSRTCGTIGAVELYSPDKGYCSEVSQRITDYCFARGVFLRPLGDVIYVLPPYSITESQLHKTWDVIKESIKHIS